LLSYLLSRINFRLWGNFNLRAHEYNKEAHNGVLIFFSPQHTQTQTVGRAHCDKFNAAGWRRRKGKKGARVKIARAKFQMSRATHFLCLCGGG
jgi:hypothetical protein